MSSNKIGLKSSIHSARQGEVKRKQGEVYGEVTKEAEIVVDGVEYPINAKKSGCHVEWLTRMIRHLVAMEYECGRIFIVRYDLHLPEYKVGNADMKRFMDAMRKRMDRDYGSSLGYLWARELATGKGPHYHIALILDGDRVSNATAVGAAIEAVWSDREGYTAFRPTHRAGYEQHMMIGRGGVPLGEATHWLSYLTKPATKGYRANYAQDFSTGHATSKARRKGQIVRVIPVRGCHLRAFVRTRSGLTSDEVRELGQVAQAGKLWLKWRAVSRVAVALNVDDRTAGRWIMEALPGQLENHKALRAARVENAKRKAFALVDDGMPVAHAAAAVGVDDMTLWYWLENDRDRGGDVLAAKRAKVDAKTQGIALLLAGASNAEVRAATGAARTTVVKWRNAAGITAPARGKAQASARAEAIAMIEAGATTREAGEAVGVHFATAAKWYKAHQAKLAPQDGESERLTA